jgi:hypothetical protein
MAEVGKDVGLGLGQAFPRLFSVGTVVGAFIMFSGSAEPGMSLFVLLMGLHGIVTNTQKVGFIRKILAWTSGAAGAVFVFNIVMQLLGIPGMQFGE